MKIQYSPEAIDDLTRLRNFIAVHNPYAAKRAASAIISGIEKLRIFPQIGLPVQRARDPQKIRDLFVSNYTIRYLIGKDTVFILRIWHGKEAEKDVRNDSQASASILSPPQINRVVFPRVKFLVDEVSEPFIGGVVVGAGIPEH